MGIICVSSQNCTLGFLWGIIPRRILKSTKISTYTFVLISLKKWKEIICFEVYGLLRSQNPMSL